MAKKPFDFMAMVKANKTETKATKGTKAAKGKETKPMGFPKGFPNGKAKKGK